MAHLFFLLQNAFGILNVLIKLKILYAGLPVRKDGHYEKIIKQKV